MCGMVALHGRKVPSTFSSRISRKATSETSWAGVSIGPVPPAVLTRMSMRPKWSTVAWMVAWTAGASSTLQALTRVSRSP
jgi:hypothetical protein